MNINPYLSYHIGRILAITCAHKNMCPSPLFFDIHHQKALQNGQNFGPGAHIVGQKLLHEEAPEALHKARQGDKCLGVVLVQLISGVGVHEQHALAFVQAHLIMQLGGFLLEDVHVEVGLGAHGVQQHADHLPALLHRIGPLDEKLVAQHARAHEALHLLQAVNQVGGLALVHHVVKAAVVDDLQRGDEVHQFRPGGHAGLLKALQDGLFQQVRGDAVEMGVRLDAQDSGVLLHLGVLLGIGNEGLRAVLRLGQGLEQLQLEAPAVNHLHSGAQAVLPGLQGEILRIIADTQRPGGARCLVPALDVDAMQPVDGHHLRRTGVALHQPGVIPGLGDQRQHAQYVLRDHVFGDVDIVADGQAVMGRRCAAFFRNQPGNAAVAAAGDDDFRPVGPPGFGQQLPQGKIPGRAVGLRLMQHVSQGVLPRLQRPAEGPVGPVALRPHALHAQRLLQGQPAAFRPGVLQRPMELLQKAELHIVSGLPRQDAEHAVAAAEAHQPCRLRGGQPRLLQAALEAVAEALIVRHRPHLLPNLPHYKWK